jgi:hypothetical protein
MSEVSPVYKKDNALEQKNHRPVSILTSSSKILEKIMENDLNESWLDSIYNKYLAAYRKGYSCQQVLLALCDHWRQLKEDKRIPAVLLADLSKAFDCLPYSLTITKLHSYGMDYNSTLLLTDYLTNRLQRVKTGGATSSWAKVLKGIPQGSIMGPVVFNIYMNDLFQFVNDGFLLNYADDNTILVDGVTKAEVMTKLHTASETIVNWCEQNQMEANPSKFQIMISDERKPSTIDIGNNTITSDTNVKLLGVYIDNKLTFSKHISEIVKKSSRQLNCLKRVAYSLDKDTKLLLYKAFVASNFNYCALVWHHCGQVNTAKLEKVQHRALKFIFNDYTSDYTTLLGRANMPTLELSRLRCVAIEVYKVYNDLVPSLHLNNINSSSNSHRYNLRSGNTIKQRHSRTTKNGLHSFRTFGVHIWNNLPPNIRTSIDLNSFKQSIKTWFGFTCKCTFCKHVKSR